MAREDEPPAVGEDLAEVTYIGAAHLEEEDFYPSPGRCVLTERGHWWAEFREDLGRYRGHHYGSVLKPFLLEQGVWALLQYRWASHIYRCRLPGPVKAVLKMVAILTQKITETVTNISIPPQAQIYPGLYIGHFGPVVINPDAVIGAGCNISQGVTIGISGRGDRRGCPVIGPRTYIGAGAVVAGAITIGSDVVIAANSLVIRDIPSFSTAMGVPATVNETIGTTGMGLHQHPRHA